MQKAFTKTGVEVIGTYEMTPGCALVAGREDGEIVYDGETKMYWDGQTTQESAPVKQSDGTWKQETIWIDANGDEVLDSEIVWHDEDNDPMPAATGAEIASRL